MDSTFRVLHWGENATDAVGAAAVLWIADAVCGAVVAHRTGESRWLEAIADRVMIRNLDHGL